MNQLKQKLIKWIQQDQRLRSRRAFLQALSSANHPACCLLSGDSSLAAWKWVYRLQWGLRWSGQCSGSFPENPFFLSRFVGSASPEWPSLYRGQLRFLVYWQWTPAISPIGLRTYVHLAGFKRSWYFLSRSKSFLKLTKWSSSRFSKNVIYIHLDLLMHHIMK